jgi:tetratricopeptide (TPR) repeat protein
MHDMPPRTRRVSVARLLCAAVLVAATGVLAAPTPTPPPARPAKGPTSEQIRQAIDDLANPRFAVREKASKLLWEAGRAAEADLRVAATAKDEETANRAKAIVEKFDWGLYPDTPPDVAQMVERFRSGDAELRGQTVGELMRLKPARFDVLRKVIAHEQNEESRKQMYARMATQAREAVPELLVNGLFDEAGELLEVCLWPNNPQSLGDYATFHYLRNRVPAAIARMEELRKRGSPTDVQRATETLVYLHRVRQDWTAARAAADATKDPELQNALAWEANDWKRLAEGNPFVANGEDEDRGAKAAYHRLAGNKAKYDEIIAELRKSLMGIEGNDDKAYDLALALLLNGQGADAIEVLKGRYKGRTDLVFDLLCAQLRFKEAFAYYDAAMKELDADPEAVAERGKLAQRRGKILAALGDRDGATQVFRAALDQALGANRDTSSIDLVQMVARTGMRELAAELAARCLESLHKNGLDDEASMVLGKVFEDRALLAAIWWRAIYADKPDAEPTAKMARLLEFLDGKADRKKADRLAELIATLKGPKGGPDKTGVDLTSRPGLSPGHADFGTAEAYRAIGAFDKAEEFFKKAANTSPRDVEDRGLLDDLPIDEDTAIVPVHYRFILGYADFLASRKRPKEAAAMYRKAWEIAPGQALPLFLCGNSLKLTGDEKEGTRLMELAHWVPLGNEFQRAKFSEDLGKRAFDVDSRKEMELVLTTGWFRGPAVGNVQLRMARIKARQGDYATAARLYEKDVISLFRNPLIFFVDGRAYLTVPELARAYRARALIAAGKFDEALAEARAGLAVMPGNIEVGLGLIPDLDKAGKKKEADEIYGKIRSTFEAAIKDYGSSPDLRNSLAWTMVNCNRDLDDALAHAKKAVEVAPKTAGYIDTLAEIYFRKKDRAKALEFMKQCAALEPTNPYFRKQLERFEKKPFDSPLPDEETGDD